jgi:modulator of FtsH protease
MAFDISAWTDYGVAVVGGAAALTGLLFVAVSVNSAWFSSSATNRDRAGQALVLFIVPLVTAILLLIPGQSTTALGIEFAVFGVLVGRVLIALGPDTSVEDEPRSMVIVDRLSPRVITTAGLIACGASLIIKDFGGLYWLAAVDVSALLAGLLNAWVFLLAAGAAAER